MLTCVDPFDTAQICRNGHVINEMAASDTSHNQLYCDRCGSSTVTACETCGARIRGYEHSDTLFVAASMPAPAHCYNCGQPYPWTTTARDAARDLADEIDGLTAEEREALKGTLDDLLKDSPKTQAASLRFKKLATKTGHEGAAMLRATLYAVVSEAARKAIWGP
jgi:hypothetical protein